MLAALGALRRAQHEQPRYGEGHASCGFRDDDYARAGAVVTVAAGVWNQAELVLKVKEPLRDEVAHIREGQILFTYLHLAAVPELRTSDVDADPLEQFRRWYAGASTCR